MRDQKQTIQIDLDDLYRALKKHDDDILKKFADETLSDDDYFFYAINSDIMSNGLNIVSNLLYGNERSIGIDQNARSLIESFVVLKMLGLGEINELQKTVYRYSYALVEFDNYPRNWSEEEKASAPYQQHLRDANKAMDALSRLFKIPKAHLEDWNYRRKKHISLDDPNLYLKQKLSDDIRFDTLMQDYPVFPDGETLLIYRFFSMFVHPRYEKNVDLEDGFQKARQNSLFVLLGYLANYLQACHLFVNPKDAPGFKEVFLENPELEGNRFNIVGINQTLMNLEKAVCYFENGIDVFSLFYYEQMRSLIVDLSLSCTLDYREHILGKFKEFLEYSSVYFAIESISDLKEFVAKKDTFCISSRIQMFSQLKTFGFAEKDKEVFTDELKGLYEDYYRDAYGVTFENFKTEIEANGLYFLKPGKKAFNAMVKDAINRVFTAKESKEIFLLYKIAKDSSHAGGYNFNASPGGITVNAARAMIWIWKIMIHNVQCVSETLHEQGIERDFAPFIAAFQELIKGERQNLERKLTAEGLQA